MGASTTSVRARASKPSDVGRSASWWQLGRLLAVIAVVVLVARRLHHGEIRTAFSFLSLADVLLVVLVLSPLTVLLRALRWRYLLHEGDLLPLRDYIGAYLVGVLANSLLLGRLGDLVKARFICGSRLNYGRSVTVVAIDRLLEGVALLLIFSGVLLTSSLPRWAYTLAWTAALGSLAILVLLRGLSRHQRRFLDGIRRVAGQLPSFLSRRVLVAAERLASGSEALTDYRRVLNTVLYAIAVWCVEIATVIVFLSAFHVPRPWFAPAAVVIVVLNFGMLVPISPGSVGVYQLLCSFALSLWGVSRESGFALGLAMQTVLFAPLYLAGAVWLLFSRRSWHGGLKPDAHPGSVISK